MIIQISLVFPYLTKPQSLTADLEDGGVESSSRSRPSHLARLWIQDLAPSDHVQYPKEPLLSSSALLFGRYMHISAVFLCHCVCATVFRQATRRSVRFFVACQEAFGLNAMTNCVNAKLSCRQKDARRSNDDSACLSVCLPDCLPACLPAYLFACLSVCLLV